MFLRRAASFLEADRKHAEQFPAANPRGAVLGPRGHRRPQFGVAAEPVVASQRQRAERHADRHGIGQPTAERIEQRRGAAAERIANGVDVGPRGRQAEGHVGPRRVKPVPRRRWCPRAAWAERRAQVRGPAPGIEWPVGRDIAFGPVGQQMHRFRAGRRAPPVQRVDVSLDDAVHDSVDVGIEELVGGRVAGAVHREDAERAGRVMLVIARAADCVDADHRPSGIHGGARRVEAVRRLGGRRPFRLVAQEGVVAAVARVAPHRCHAPRDARGPPLPVGVEERPGEAGDEKIDHGGIVSGHLRVALVVFALGVVVARPGVCVRGRHDQPVRADAGGLPDTLRREPVQVGRQVPQIGDEDRHLFPHAVLEHERSGVKAQPVSGRAFPLRPIPGKSHSWRRGDVRPAESGPQPAARYRLRLLREGDGQGLLIPLKATRDCQQDCRHDDAPAGCAHHLSTRGVQLAESSNQNLTLRSSAGSALVRRVASSTLHWAWLS